MSEWSLEVLLSGLHDDIEQRLARARQSFGHAPTVGDASESVWRDLLTTHLPKRYDVASAHVVDSEGVFSDQIDIVIFDRQYTPLIFKFEGHTIIPAESVYAVFEAKQTVSAQLVKYAMAKCASVRQLTRTSLPVPHAGGTFDAKSLSPILGGILSFESEWKPAVGDTFVQNISAGDDLHRLDMGCVASHAFFVRDGTNINVHTVAKPATAFLLELIAQLQALATVPMLDVRAYARWLA